MVADGPGLGVGADADGIGLGVRAEAGPGADACGIGHRAHPNLGGVKVRPRRRPRRLRRAPRDPWSRFRAGLIGLVAVLVIGTAGYTVLGLSVLDAVYQTVVTVSTVGFRELGEVGHHYQFFTITLIMFGTGTALYTLGVLLETLFEGHLNDQFGRRRMQKEIDGLRDHIVVCGYGQVGQAIAVELSGGGREVVIVDRRHDLDPEIPLVVVGEATDDEVLARAGLHRARTLILALDSDTDNLYVTLTARALRSDLFIVARANSSTADPKLHRAGADRVVNPHEIGGHRMAELALEPPADLLGD